MQTELPLTSSAGDTPVSHLVMPGSDGARKMTAISGRKCIGSWLPSGPVGCLAKMLLGTSWWGSTKCFLTWRPSTTPQGRLLFRLVPSMPRTDETGFGLWRTPRTTGLDGGSNSRKAAKARGMWPTPTALDYKNEALSAEATARRQRESSRGVRISEVIKRTMLPTPNAGSDHWGGRLDELGGSGNPFRGMEIGRVKLNPVWIEKMMGFPADWTALEPSATPSSRKSLKPSATPS